MNPRTKIARRLRSEMTEAERALWGRLRNSQLHGMRFRRQEPIGPYIVDFVCREAHLVIEVDGGQHADDANDRERDAFLRNGGFRVLRFWNNEVVSNLGGVLEHIASAADVDR